MHLEQRQETPAELHAWRSSDLVLPDETQKRVRKLLNEAVEGIDRLDCKILEAEEHLVDLKQRRIADADRIATLRAAISSVKKLPPETFTEIFMYFNTGYVKLPPKKAEYSYPWILGHICSRWRQILWSSPSLWDTIEIHHLNEIDLTYLTAVWDNIIRQSLNYVLSNTTTPIDLTVSNDRAARISDILITHNHRFRELTIGGADAGVAFQLFDLPPTSLTNLEKLQISWVCDSHSAHLNRMRSALQTAPNLRSVSFVCTCPFISQLPMDFLPWPQLTELIVLSIEISPEIIYTAFQRCPSLQSCQFQISNDPIILRAQPQPITLSTLEALNLGANYRFDWERFIHPLITPALGQLDIFAAVAPTTKPFLSLITRSNCALLSFTLKIKGKYSHGTDFEPFLQRMPSLTWLEVPWVMPATIIKRIQEGLLPQLETGIWKARPDGLSATLDLVDSLIPQISNHRRLSIYVSYSPGPAFTEVQDRYLASYLTYEGTEGLRLRLINDPIYLL